MTTLLLIRHGETDAVGKSIMGWSPGWSLNGTGKRQVKELAERLSPASIRAVYTSPLERAIETAKAICAPHRIRPKVRDGLGEMRMGEWEGKEIRDLVKLEDFKRYNTYRSGFRPPGGELMIEAQVRMVQQLFELCREHANETIAVVSHGDPLRAALAHFLGLPLDMLLRFEIVPASVSIVEVGDWAPRVLCINHAGELPL